MYGQGLPCVKPGTGLSRSLYAGAEGGAELKRAALRGKKSAADLLSILHPQP